MEDNVTRHFIRYGIMYALIQIIIAVAMYVAGADFFAANMFLFFFLVVVLMPIGYTIYSIIQFRKSVDGYMTLKSGFMVTFFTLAVAGLITSIFTIVLYNFIDKEYPHILSEKVAQRTVEVMESMGMSEAEIEKQLERSGDTAEQFTISGQVRGYLSALFIYAIYSLILGLIFKRTRPPFEQQIS